MAEHLKILLGESVDLLKTLIATPSFSRDEGDAAAVVENYLRNSGIPFTRIGNNVIARNRSFDALKPTILLNSHLDTVKPNPKYTRDPFTAFEENGRITGLGSNDAGGPLVALIATFRYFQEAANLRHNLILAATAEEEISGSGGIESVLPHLPPIDFALVGEPTGMGMAIAERGLMVLDCLSQGRAGHAARNEGDNAIYKAMEDIQKIRSLKFPKISDLLGPCSLNVTVMETENKAHNVIPATCRFVVDARVNECYTFEEIIELIRAEVSCEIRPRSTRLRSTLIPTDHPLVQAGHRLGLTCYGSPTTSDKALMPFPALKIGPGDSARSHTADEYIYISEISAGIDIYTRLLNEVI
jgi:acetylornithine deacetylase